MVDDNEALHSGIIMTNGSKFLGGLVIFVLSQGCRVLKYKDTNFAKNKKFPKLEKNLHFKAKNFLQSQKITCSPESHSASCVVLQATFS